MSDRSLSELTSVLKDAETGQRGYLLTGDDTYLEPYRLADASIDNVIKQLRDLTADNPAQAHRLEQALPLIQSKMAELKQTIDLRRSEGLDAALKVVASRPGKRLHGQHKASGHSKWMTRNEIRCGGKRRGPTSAASFSETTIISASLLAFVLTGPDRMVSYEFIDPADRISSCAPAKLVRRASGGRQFTVFRLNRAGDRDE